jgi:hypothetical protein
MAGEKEAVKFSNDKAFAAWIVADRPIRCTTRSTERPAEAAGTTESPTLLDSATLATERSITSE